MATILSRRIEAGRGLDTEQGYILYVSTDNTTITVTDDNKLTILPLDTEHIQDEAITLSKLDVNLRLRYESQLYAWSEETGILPCFMILPNDHLKRIYVASQNCYIDSSDYWNINVYRWSSGDSNYTLLVGPVALTGTTNWDFLTTLTPNFTANQKTIIAFSFTATGNAPNNARCMILAEIEKKE